MTPREVIDRAVEKLKPFGTLIYLVRTGSHLYGTNTPESDEDFVGVFIPHKEYLIGFKEVKEVDCSIVDKDESGKNTKDATDIKVYSLKQFLKLAGDVNPNIVELLFVNKENILFMSEDFRIFRENYHLFINERVQHSFQGYARQQFKKGVTKAQNFNKLKEIIKILDKYDDKEILAVVVEKEPELKKLDKGQLIEISGLSFQKNIFVKKAKKQMKEKLKIASHRASMWEKFGYDTKFFMHLFRLLNEGEDLITKGKLEFPVRDREFLMQVRNGKFSLEYLQELAEQKFENFKKLECNLPKKANWNEIEKLYMNVVQKYICEE
jgi:predicted nucleotidyltransferase